MNKGITRAKMKSTTAHLNGTGAGRGDAQPADAKSVTIRRLALEDLDGLAEQAREQLVAAAGLFALVDGDGIDVEEAARVREDFNEAISSAAAAVRGIRDNIELLQDGTHHTYTDAERHAMEDARRADERELEARAARLVSERAHLHASEDGAEEAPLPRLRLAGGSRRH